MRDSLFSQDTWDLSAEESSSFESLILSKILAFQNIFFTEKNNEIISKHSIVRPDFELNEKNDRLFSLILYTWMRFIEVQTKLNNRVRK